MLLASRGDRPGMPLISYNAWGMGGPQVVWFKTSVMLMPPMRQCDFQLPAQGLKPLMSLV